MTQQQQGLGRQEQQALSALLAGCNAGNGNAVLQQLIAEGGGGNITAQLQQLLQGATMGGGGGSAQPSVASMQQASTNQQQQAPMVQQQFQQQQVQSNYHQQQSMHQLQQPMAQQPQQNQPQQSFQQQQQASATPLSSLATQLQQLVQSGNLSSAQAQQLLVTAASNQGMNANIGGSTAQHQSFSSFQPNNSGNSNANATWGTSNGLGQQQQPEQKQFMSNNGAGQMNCVNQDQQQQAFFSNSYGNVAVGGNLGGNSNLASQAQQVLSGNSSLALQAQQLLTSGGMTDQNGGGGSNGFSSQAQSLAEQIVRAAGATNVAQLLQHLGQQKPSQPSTAR